jgi:hypothetical protein
MSRAELILRLNHLYEVVEVNNIGAVPLQVAAETLRLVNPGLAVVQAEAIALDCDSRGKQQLTKEDFGRAALTCLQNTDVSDAIGLVKDLTARMRVAFRRRFLMYDAPANSPPPTLLENAKAVAMYRELFDIASRDADGMSRPELHRLMHAVLPEYAVDAANACKAALSDQETDLIGFYEFMMVLQPCTSRRCLSDMLIVARRELSNSTDDDFVHVAAGSVSSGPKATPSKPGQRPLVQKTATERLRQELQSYQMHETFADQRAQSTMSTRVALASLPHIPPPPAPPKVAADEELERINDTLRLENEDLRRRNALLTAELANAEAQLRQAVQGKSRGRSQSRSIAPGSSHEASNSYDEGDYAARIQELEDELRQARARLAIAGETAELVSLLRRGDSAHSVVRHFYQDESVLIGKHHYLQEASNPFLDGVSPICTILGQYDLVVVGYQALYRQLRARCDSEKTKSTFDPVEAARSIVPRGSVHVTPARRGSTSVARSSPMRWKDLDREPTADMRGTGTLADPLLTDEGRHMLRAKLAAQMRGTARHYTPQRHHTPMHASAHWSREIAGAPVVMPTTTTQDTLQRLQSVVGRAQRHRQLD